MTSTRRFFLLAAMAAAITAFTGCSSEEPLTADSILAMVNTGVTADEIISKAAGATFGLSDEQIATLREKGWTDEQLKTILGKEPPAPPVSKEDFWKWVGEGKAAAEIADMVKAGGAMIEINDDEVQKLRAAGWTDEQIQAVSGRAELPAAPVEEAAKPATATANPCAPKAPTAPATVKVPVTGTEKKTQKETEAKIPKAPTGVKLDPTKKTTK